MHLLLQFYADCFETLQVFRSCSEDVHIVWVYIILRLFFDIFFHKINFKKSCVLSCFMIAHIFKDKHKVAGDINSLNLLVFHETLQRNYRKMTI